MKPFTIVKEKGAYMTTLGKYVVLITETEEEAVKKIKNKDWQLILNATKAWGEILESNKTTEKTEE